MPTLFANQSGAGVACVVTVDASSDGDQPIPIWAGGISPEADLMDSGVEVLL